MLRKERTRCHWPAAAAPDAATAPPAVAALDRNAFQTAAFVEAPVHRLHVVIFISGTTSPCAGDNFRTLPGTKTAKVVLLIDLDGLRYAVRTLQSTPGSQHCGVNLQGKL